jgi:hypothetical protein
LVDAVFTLSTSSFTHTTAADALIINGLPFTHLAGSIVSPGSLSWQGITKALYTDCYTLLGSGTTQIVIMASGSAVSRSLVVAADMPTGGSVLFTGSIRFSVSGS